MILTRSPVGTSQPLYIEHGQAGGYLYTFASLACYQRAEARASREGTAVE